MCCRRIVLYSTAAAAAGVDPRTQHFFANNKVQDQVGARYSPENLRRSLGGGIGMDAFTINENVLYYVHHSKQST